MDRQIFYPAELLSDVQLLLSQKNGLLALGHLAQDVLGTGPVATGLACSPNR